ncbi:hypothetical protein V8C86DRAFT_3028810 [Haematococcus lacustris]
MPEDVAPRPTDVKQALAKKCTLKFHSSITDDTVKFWYQNHRGAWPSPKGALKDSAVRIFWDIENCRPEEEFGPLPINYSNMFRSAFKASTDARSLRCIASLSRTYPGTGQLALAKVPAEEELRELRAQALAGKLPGRCGKPLDLDAGI